MNKYSVWKQSLLSFREKHMTDDNNAELKTLTIHHNNYTITNPNHNFAPSPGEVGF